MATAPLVEGRLCPSEARSPSLAPHPPVTLTSPSPVERKPDTVKGGRSFPALLRLGRTPKGQQPGLLRVQGQSEAPQPFLKHPPHPPCIVLLLKADDEVVALSDQACLSPKSRSHLDLKPQVEYLVEIQIT
jgi:hypothetical protein